jgi:starvation-inducible outer membrane lipoprotein
LCTTLSATLTHSQAVSLSILKNQLGTEDSITQIGLLALDEMGKINKTAVNIIDVMMEGGRRWDEKFIGWNMWNYGIQVLSWISRGVWGGTHFCF